jgi:ATP-binding cassette subfamily C protein CydD
LCGFWQWQGNIKVSGLLFNEINIEQWRQKIGYLHQKPEFLPGSIANNLRIVNPKASEEQLYQCLYEVGLISSLSNFSDFLQLHLIDNASNLSGGEQQRLAIARLLISEKPIWLLDEPWVHLDPDNAKALILLIQRCAKHKTVILVSHQLEHLEWLTHRFQLMPKDSIADSHGYLTEVVDV